MLEIISSRKNTDLSLPSEMQYLPEYVVSQRRTLSEMTNYRLLINMVAPLCFFNCRLGGYMKDQRWLIWSILNS